MQSDFVAALMEDGMRQHFSSDAKVAAEIYRQVLALSPNHPEALHFLGVISIQNGDAKQAVELISKSLALNKTNAAAISSLATAHTHLGNIDKAIEYFKKSIAINTNDASTYNNYASALKIKGRSEEAMAAYKKSIAINPNNPMPLNNLAIMLQQQGEIEAALDYFRRALLADPNYAHAHSNLIFAMHYSAKYSREELFREAQKWAEKFAPVSLAEANHPNDKNPGRKLKIGYVSSDFTAHPAAYGIKKILENHDKNNFEIFCYANNKTEDHFTEKLKSYANHWRKISGVNDDDAAAMIRADKIDILIDLAGHTNDHRLLVFARKPAPIQITWIGYFDTTGMPQMDYIMVDEFLYKPDDEKFFSEKPLVIEGRVAAWDIPNAAAEIAPPPVVKSGYITFGSFNSIAKIGEQVIKIWSEILRAVPGSKILLKTKALENKQVKSRICRSFAEYGIAEERLRLAADSPRAEYFAAYNEVDIALDPFPYNGGTTTADTLWMGVPVITLSSNSYLSRSGASIIGGSGLPELIATTKEEYVEKAVNLAGDQAKLKVMREEMREKISAGPAYNGTLITANVERTFRKVWRDYLHTL